MMTFDYKWDMKCADVHCSYGSRIIHVVSKVLFIYEPHFLKRHFKNSLSIFKIEVSL